MNLNPSDPDIATLLTRINNEDLELQPDFQRGEVWSYSKKQKLIDSILRGWHIPPIHVIETKDSAKQEVLDGQQRLVAIRDFANGKVRVDGRAEPFDDEILKLNQMHYSDLPGFFRRRFDQFTIRVIRISDFKPSEPAELFFRLNQPVSLTTAEQRNAFFGQTRHQIRELVQAMAFYGLDKDLVGFSNSRMAYDDVIARVAMTLDFATLSQKIDAGKLASQYRADRQFSERSVSRIDHAISLLSGINKDSDFRIKFNKATLYSWLLFIVRASDILGDEFNSDVLNGYVYEFEMLRRFDARLESRFIGYRDIVHDLMNVYEDRSTSRVGDVSSVIFRDLVIWILFVMLDFEKKQNISSNRYIVDFVNSVVSIDYPEGKGGSVCQNWLEKIVEISDWSSI